MTGRVTGQITGRITGWITGRGRQLRVGLVVMGGFAVAGVLAGVLWAGWWAWWWTPPVGVVVDGTWLLRGDDVRREFAATGSYALVAGGVGLVVGAGISWWYSAQAFATLAASLAGSLLAGWLMAATGSLLGPPDPRRLAAGEPDGTRLVSDLQVQGVGAYAAFPVGAVTGVAAVLFLGPGRRQRESGQFEEGQVPFTP